jgi:membrane-associated protease RseP (regulator of RpoE activity)
MVFFILSLDEDYIQSFCHFWEKFLNFRIKKTLWKKKLIIFQENLHGNLWKIISRKGTNYKLKLIFLSGTCLLILLKYMENLEYSGQKKLRKSILACNFLEKNETFDFFK